MVCSAEDEKDCTVNYPPVVSTNVVIAMVIGVVTALLVASAAACLLYLSRKGQYRGYPPIDLCAYIAQISLRIVQHFLEWCVQRDWAHSMGP